MSGGSETFRGDTLRRVTISRFSRLPLLAGLLARPFLKRQGIHELRWLPDGHRAPPQQDQQHPGPRTAIGCKRIQP